MIINKNKQSKIGQSQQKKEAKRKQKKHREAQRHANSHTDFPFKAHQTGKYNP